ncbi:MAG: LlaJI family restriction endonuclease [Methanobrevibacter sp.]|uniref:LlaJI family restriction endonuclease n=1 Tax=Methanobrevibacter sp. TaxID=66852 RepID=UPI0025FCCC81|nr:LlaJI family restriction endonuclease [Methanobrevibacter sp.]MBE6498053.1 LlaJI family restriction endonuclease [Methanobrevibacter sp.]MBE6499342.1 LlaJI family restriction endonuclease [Methanobrevibacter thaueri]
MKNVYIKELKYYSRRKILEILQNDENVLDKLLKYDIVKFTNDGYQFVYVGVIIIENIILNIYPKYITSESNIKADFKQVINVVKKYNNAHDDFRYENDELEDISYNRLSMMLFFIEDYYENGVYSNIQNILQTNGNGEIDWNRTVNENVAILKDGKPYYTDLQTKYKINDLFNYFRLLHEYIITECSIYLEKAGLLELFDLTPVELSDKEQDDFGDIDLILQRLQKELNVEFNTQKQKLLQSMYSYMSNKNAHTNENYLTLYGTPAYHEIWEAECAYIFGDKLHKRLKDLTLPVNLNSKYPSNKKLIDLIKKPKWIYKNIYPKEAEGTFIPDTVTFHDSEFVILDAKYYNLKFTQDNLDGQPGLESITKQYLYELAFKEFIEDHEFKGVKNAFLFPSYGDKIENKGKVKLDILSDLGLEDIQVIMLPASKVNEMYLDKNIKYFTINDLFEISENMLSEIKNNKIKSLIKKLNKYRQFDDAPDDLRNDFLMELRFAKFIFEDPKGFKIIDYTDSEVFFSFQVFTDLDEFKESESKCEPKIIEIHDFESFYSPKIKYLEINDYKKIPMAKVMQEIWK